MLRALIVESYGQILPEEKKGMLKMKTPLETPIFSLISFVSHKRELTLVISRSISIDFHTSKQFT